MTCVACISFSFGKPHYTERNMHLQRCLYTSYTCVPDSHGLPRKCTRFLRASYYSGLKIYFFLLAVRVELSVLLVQFFFSSVPKITQKCRSTWEFPVVSKFEDKGNILGYHRSQVRTQLSCSGKDLAKLQISNTGFLDVGHQAKSFILHIMLALRTVTVVSTYCIITVKLRKP